MAYTQEKNVKWVKYASVRKKEDFPSGPVVKSPPANAGHMGSLPALGRSCLPGQLSLSTTALNLSSGAHTRPEHRSQRKPSRAATRTQRSQK